MKSKTSHTVEQEHEIELPHYRTIPLNNYYYKVISEQECIVVQIDKPQIQLTYASLAFLINGHYETTKEEFEQAFDSVMTKLNNLKSGVPTQL